MRQNDPIADYLAALAAELAFDVRLAQRVCDEIADHLWEAVDSTHSNNAPEAQRRAIASVGSAHDLAAQYLPISLFTQARRVGGYAILAIAGIVVGMKGCSAWCEMTHAAVSGDLRTLDVIGLLIDRSASILALITGIIGWAYITFHEVPAKLKAQHGKFLKRSIMIFSLVTGALLLSIGSDAFVIGLRVSAANRLDGLRNSHTSHRSRGRVGRTPVPTTAVDDTADGDRPTTASRLAPLIHQNPETTRFAGMRRWSCMASAVVNQGNRSPSMQTVIPRKSAFRGLLTLHFIGLAIMIGATVANLVINQRTGQGTLEALASGRDLSGFVTRSVVLPGFLVTVSTGIAMTLLRYGRRVPGWVMIKVALNVITLAVGARFVAPRSCRRKALGKVER